MSTFWADERAEAVEARHSAPYVVSDTKTPSGTIHVGSLRGVVLHDAMRRLLMSRGHDVTYLYGFDDFDPFDKVPNYLDASYAEHLGKPMCDIPAPDSDGKPSGEVTADRNYGRHYANEFEAVYRSLGVDSTTVYSANEYRRGVFDEAIRLTLDRADQIQAAYDEAIAHRSDDRQGKDVVAKYPVNVRCEACGRIATTEVAAWDGTVVTYVCRPGVAQYADGCGHEGTVSPFGGNAKLPWKIEWAAKWFAWKSDIEGGGKDHYTKGGSRDVSKAVFDRIFADQAAPGYNTVPEDLFYEWFYVAGKKMSTSKGVGQSAASVAAQIPAELLRLLMVRSRPKTAVNYEETPDAIPDLYDEYDRLLAAYRTEPESIDGALFDLIRIRQHDELPTFVMRFRTLTNLIQIPAIDIEAWAADEKGQALTDAESRELRHRVDVARKWLETWPEQRLYELQETLPALELSTEQRTFLGQFAAQLPVEWTGEVLQACVLEAAKVVGLPTKKAFEAMYLIFLGQPAGPRAGRFLASLDREFVVARLAEALE